jgi:uncharacterized protein with HEPN domain
MRLESRTILEDVRAAASCVAEFTADVDFDGYCADRMLQSAVERQFEIIGEALKRLSKIDTETACLIDNYKRIIAFRNILIHGYDVVDNAVVWDIVKQDLPKLHDQVMELLG